MPKIEFNNQMIECKLGSNLRRVLMAAGLPLYNGVAEYIHCRGMGTCGTCALEIDGEVSAMTKVEKWRLGFPPHRAGSQVSIFQPSTVSTGIVYRHKC